MALWTLPIRGNHHHHHRMPLTEKKKFSPPTTAPPLPLNSNKRLPQSLYPGHGNWYFMNGVPHCPSGPTSPLASGP